MLTIPEDQWRDPAPTPAIAAGEVHLWRSALDSVGETLAHTLSVDEWVRADRYHFEKDRRRFIAGRSLLRSVLAKYTGVPAAQIRFTSGTHGKPALAHPANTLRFNVSHSDDLILIAITHSRDIGIDVELVRDDVPFDDLAERYFEPEDAWDIRVLPPAAKAWRFYNVWTSTEARLKASGVGLSEGTRVIAPNRWSLLSLIPFQGYAASLAVEGSTFQLECWAWRN